MTNMVVAGIEMNSAEVAMLVALDMTSDAMSVFEAMQRVEQRDHKAVEAWLNSLRVKGILRPYPDHNGIDAWMYQDNDVAQAVFAAIHSMDINPL